VCAHYEARSLAIAYATTQRCCTLNNLSDEYPKMILGQKARKTCSICTQELRRKQPGVGKAWKKSMEGWGRDFQKDARSVMEGYPQRHIRKGHMRFGI